MGVKLIGTNFSSTDLVLFVLKLCTSYFSCHSEKILGSLSLRKGGRLYWDFWLEGMQVMKVKETCIRDSLQIEERKLILQLGN